MQQQRTWGAQKGFAEKVEFELSSGGSRLGWGTVRGEAWDEGSPGHGRNGGQASTATRTAAGEAHGLKSGLHAAHSPRVAPESGMQPVQGVT